jgi:SAM-dependent methyltransferase/chromosome segregation ATPase
VLEFTGERVVPGQVEPDLWNEHLARYLFAARLAGRKRVLDMGCGTGYGAAELARLAASVAAFDLFPQAVALARSAYPLPNLYFLAASAAAIPFPDASFQLITCFEVIEHVADWQTLLTEAQRLLARGGQFIISTPNKLYYAESREQIGPNPFHVHEFEYEEFREALTAVFPSVTLYLQNHVGGLSFQPVAAPNAQSPDLHLESSQSDPPQAHFFVAVCAVARQTGAPAFLHIPSTSNVLREREGHVHKLQDEIRLKDTWLKQHQEDLSKLLAAHTAQEQELERAQSWAQAEHEQFEAARCELLATAAAYEERLAAAEKKAKALLDAQIAELEKVQKWAQSEHEQFEALSKAYRAQTEELRNAQKWAQSEHEQFEASRRKLLATAQAYEERLAANERTANEILEGRTKELEGAQAWALSVQREFEALGTAYRAQTAEFQNAQKWAQSEHEQFEASRRELLATAQACEERLAANERTANEILEGRTKELEGAQAWALSMQREFEALGTAYRAQTEELQNAQKWAQSEHEQFEASRRELLATAQAYEDRLAANESAAADLLNRRAKELEKAVKWAQSEHEQFEALGRELLATSERYEALLETNAHRHQEDLSELNRRLDETKDQHQAGIGRLNAILEQTESERQAAREEINRLRTILSAVHQSRWVKLGRSIKIGPDLDSF